MVKLLNYTKEFKYNLVLSYPVTIGLLGHTIVQLIDNIMVGRLGTSELAAVSLGNSFILIAMSIGIGFSTAITPLVSESIGKKNNREKDFLNHGLLLCSLLGLLMFVSIYNLKDCLFIMGQVGATSVHFEGIPSYPNWNRFWKVCEKYKVNQFYTSWGSPR